MVWLGEAKYLGLGNDDKPNENIFLIQEISGDYRKVAILQYTDELWLQTTPWLCRKPSIGSGVLLEGPEPWR